MKGKLNLSGELSARLIKAPKEKKVFHLKNWLKCKWQMLRIRLGGFISGQFIPYGTLRARVIRKDGTIEDHGVLGHACVTDDGVEYLVDDWDDDSTDITTMNYHDSGTGTNGELAGDSALQTPCGEARDAGSKTQPSANVLQTVATHTYAGTFAITEHGIFSAAAAGVLWDRTVFSAINVVASDKIEFTYQCTISSGS